jgi:NTP pyrophosphatase (non-canonical NTP hydrolase)
MKKEQSLEFWVESFVEIYGHQHSRREVTEMWLPVVQYGSKIAEDIRKAEYGAVHEHIAHLFAWFCSFVGRCKYFEDFTHPFYRIEENLSDIIGFKYPNKCGHCASNPCDCSKLRMALEKANDKQIQERRLDRARALFKKTYPGWTVQDWVDMFAEIYSNSIYSMPIESIAFHLMEEIGEVARAIRGLIEYEGSLDAQLDPEYRIDLETKRASFKFELADVFSWLIAVYLKLRLIEMGVGIRLEQEFEGLSEDVWAQYGIPDEDRAFCARCKKNPCQCVLQFRVNRLYKVGPKAKRDDESAQKG